MIKEMGVSTITICCLCLSSLSAANTITREIEKGTIMTLLSKPVDKHSILLGKFFGILASVSLIFILMGVLLTVSLCIKESLDYRIGVLTSFARVGYPTGLQLVFSFLQIAIMCAIATAGSVFLPMLSNLSSCIGIYVIGNLINFFHRTLQMNGGRWYLSFFFFLFPNFEEFSTLGVENRFETFSLSYMAVLTIYAMLYIMFVIVLALALFDRKECR
jgi:ABC-type transport system involved in multi-copper enzyme maturation permease subunit